MFNFDINKFMADKTRLMQLVFLGAIALFGLLTAVVEAGVLRFFFLLSVLGFVFFSIIPVYLAVLNADTDSLGRSGYYGLKAAECAGSAGIAVVILMIFSAIGTLTGKGTMTHMYGLVVFAVQGLAGIGMALGVGLTSLLRANKVELEFPPPPEPKPKPAPQAGYQQPYPQGYPQQPGYPPQPGYPQGYPKQPPTAAPQQPEAPASEKAPTEGTEEKPE